MPKTVGLIAARFSRVTIENVRRFADTVDIRDAGAFATSCRRSSTS